jgi:hypothetical protein
MEDATHSCIQKCTILTRIITYGVAISKRSLHCLQIRTSNNPTILRKLMRKASLFIIDEREINIKCGGYEHKFKALCQMNGCMCM